MTFAYADYARQTEAMSDSQIIDEIMSHLKDMYGNNIPQPTNFYAQDGNPMKIVMVHIRTQR